MTDNLDNLTARLAERLRAGEEAKNRASLAAAAKGLAAFRKKQGTAQKPARRQTPRSFKDKFLLYHELNPHVYECLVELTRDLKNRGHQKLGINMISEVVRWLYGLTTTDPNSQFKISNDYRPYYARMIMEREPDLQGIFDLKRQFREDA